MRAKKYMTSLWLAVSDRYLFPDSQHKSILS